MASLSVSMSTRWWSGGRCVPRPVRNPELGCVAGEDAKQTSRAPFPADGAPTGPHRGCDYESLTRSQKADRIVNSRFSPTEFERVLASNPKMVAKIRATAEEDVGPTMTLEEFRQRFNRFRSE
jgi:hypothetical protein